MASITFSGQLGGQARFGWLQPGSGVGLHQDLHDDPLERGSRRRQLPQGLIRAEWVGRPEICTYSSLRSLGKQGPRRANITFLSTVDVKK